MDRLNKVHHASRVELPRSVINSDAAQPVQRRSRRLLPVVSHYIAVISFMGGGAVVIATASLLALSIR